MGQRILMSPIVALEWFPHDNVIAHQCCWWRTPTTASGTFI